MNECTNERRKKETEHTWLPAGPYALLDHLGKLYGSHMEIGEQYKTIIRLGEKEGGGREGRGNNICGS